MFFVFHFLVFAYFTHSEINCFTQGSTRTTNYVKGDKEISNLRDAPQFKHVNHRTNKLNTDLKSNVIDKILSEEMLIPIEHKQKDISGIKIFHSSKQHLVTPTDSKRLMFNNINNLRDDVRKLQKTNTDRKSIFMEKILIKDEEFLEPVLKSESHETTLQSDAKNLQIFSDVSKTNKVTGFKSDILSSGSGSKKVIEMRSLPDSKEKCTCKRTNPSGSCNCASNNHSKKRCTHAAQDVRAHQCSRYGSSVTNHSCSQGPEYGKLPSVPYTFYPIYLPNMYTYFASQAPIYPYKISYPQPNLISDLKIPRKRKHKCHKATPRFDQDLYYDDNDSRESKDDDNLYYLDLENKKDSTKDGLVYDVNQDTLIKEIVKDLKIHTNKEYAKECYCDSASSCRSTMFIITLTILYFVL